jgi:hypothetical protein
MEENHVSPPPTTETQSSDHGMSSNGANLENVRLRAELFRSLLEEVEDGRLDATSLSLRLQEAGATSEEAKDYLEQLQENLRHRRHGASSEGRQNDTAIQEESNVTPNQSADAIVWAQLRQKLGEIGRGIGEGSSEPDTGLGTFAKILEFTKPRAATIPADVLTEAPHLQGYLKSAQAESLIERTWKLRQSYATEKATDAIIDLMQRQSVPDPLPRSIWKDIILDKYVDFEKLHAGMDRGYDHDDEPKDFGGGYAIVKRDHFRARKPVQTESEWTRIARAWKYGVELLYPHRQTELGTYMEIIEELFRAAPQSPSIAICVDAEVRDKYAKHPFRMDDRNQLHTPILAHMLRIPSTLYSNSAKRRGSPSSPANKKAKVVCRNWNLGFCNDDECPYQRTHACYECGEDHRAKEREVCLGKFKKRRRSSGQTKPSGSNQ